MKRLLLIPLCFLLALPLAACGRTSPGLSLKPSPSPAPLGTPGPAAKGNTVIYNGVVLGRWDGSKWMAESDIPNAANIGDYLTYGNGNKLAVETEITLTMTEDYTNNEVGKNGIAPTIASMLLEKGIETPVYITQLYKVRINGADTSILAASNLDEPESAGQPQYSMLIVLWDTLDYEALFFDTLANPGETNSLTAQYRLAEAADLNGDHQTELIIEITDGENISYAIFAQNDNGDFVEVAKS